MRGTVTVSYTHLSRQDAEECVNDAYLGAWYAIPPARPNPLLSYLVKIVRNISLKIYWRKEAAKRSKMCIRDSWKAYDTEIQRNTVMVICFTVTVILGLISWKGIKAQESE